MKTLASLLLALSFAAVAAEPGPAPAPAAAPDTGMTWLQANQRSAALLRSDGDRKQAADFARVAFDLYPEQAKTYSEQIHAQLLLNLIDARREAEGVDAALRELDRGAAAVEKRVGATAQVMFDLWQAGAAMAGRGTDRAGAYSERALGVAEQLFGVQEPRTITALLNAVHDLKGQRGYSWALGKYLEARKRAERGDNAALADQISLFMAKLDLESGNTDRAVNGYRALIERLERHADGSRDALLHVAYAQLEHLYEKREDTRSATEVRRRRMDRLPEQPAALVPLVRVQPEYPRAATGKGFVELQILVGADGAVQDVIVMAAEPAGVFEASAIEAVRQWKFKPKVVDNVAVVSAGRQRIDYQPWKAGKPDPRRVR